ncbi:MAG: radical SAM protein, partial [Candidatus Cloacimonetes bacterium]|nr:radical SAM protein [Candidatus Cloacimonadota bacterium]
MEQRNIMSFYDIIEKYKDFDFEAYFDNVTDEDIRRTLNKDKLSYLDFLNLLSERAQNHLEAMAQKARRLTIQYFGRTIGLYIPMYLANYCSNECIYCGFNKTNKILRRKLTPEAVEAEALEIAKTEMKHVLLLTGEAKEVTPPDYLENCIKIMKKHFSSISIEIFPMDEDEYRSLKQAGVDGLTIYQEVYDEEVYRKVHLSGQKADYRYRLDTPERGAKAGFRMINLGTLFGLGEKKKEAFFSGMHAMYLEDKYIDTEISLSLPRINEAEGGFKPYHPINDIDYV